MRNCFTTSPVSDVSRLLVHELNRRGFTQMHVFALNSQHALQSYLSRMSFTLEPALLMMAEAFW